MHKDITTINVEIEYDLSGFELMLSDCMKESQLVINMAKAVHNTKLMNNSQVRLNPPSILILFLHKHSPKNLMEPFPPIKIFNKTEIIFNQTTNLLRISQGINK